MARKWTEEQKQAARERLAAARAKKAEMLKVKEWAEKKATTQAEKEVEEIKVSGTTADPEATTEYSGEQSQDDLVRQIEELKAALAAKQSANPTADLVEAIKMLASSSSPQQTNKKLTVEEVYSTDLELYDDPRERLRNESRLKRIAFDENFELDWKVEVFQYPTLLGETKREPKFNLRLIQIVLDDQGEPTDTRIVRSQMVFFEDPETAMVMAQRLGLPIDENSQKEFLNEMRYYRMRDWLMEKFWKPKTDVDRSNLRTVAYEGKVVEMYEVAKDEGDTAAIPFDKMKKFKF